MSDNKITAIYCRLALADSERIAAQEETLRHYVVENGFGDFAVYRDNGWGGSTLDRPAMKELMADIETGKIFRVIVLDISRVARNFLVIEDWLDFLKQNGAECITLDMGKIATDYLR